MNQQLNKRENWQRPDMIEDISTPYGSINYKIDENLRWWHIFIIHPVMCLLIAAGAALIIYSAIYG